MMLFLEVNHSGCYNFHISGFFCYQLSLGDLNESEKSIIDKSMNKYK